MAHRVVESTEEENEKRPLDKHAVRAMMVAASYHARRVSRALKLDNGEREDIEQELLLTLLERRSYFDPNRGAWSTFAALIARQALKAIVADVVANRKARYSSLDEEFLQRDVPDAAIFGNLYEASPESRLQVELSIVRFIAGLPEELAVVAKLALEEEGDFAQAQRRSSLSTSEFYRRLREVRYRLGPLGVVRRRFSLPDR